MDTLLVAIVTTCAIALNCGATLAILRDGLLTKGQRRYQLLLAWGIPFVGSAVVIGVKRAQAQRASPLLLRDSGTSPNGEAIEYSNDDHHHSEPPSDFLGGDPPDPT